MFEQALRQMINEAVEERLSRHSALNPTPPKEIVPKQWLSAREAADYVGVCRSTIHNWVNRRLIHQYRIGRGVVRYSRQELDTRLQGQFAKTRGAA